jgi:hypothetical protein
MDFLITFPFWAMLILIVLNAVIVLKMDIDVTDDDRPLNH